MDINLFSLAYLFFRLLPISIVLLLMFDNFIWRGITYGAGLFMCFLVNYMILGPGYGKTSPQCDTFNFVGTYGKNTPHSIVIIVYSFIYLLYFYYINDNINNRLHVILFFVVLVILDTCWNVMYSCVSTNTLAFSALITTVFSIYWSRTISNSNISSLNIENTTGCKKISSTIFRCGNTDKTAVVEETEKKDTNKHKIPGHYHPMDNKGNFQEENEFFRKDTIQNFLPTSKSGYEFPCIYDCHAYVGKNSDLGYKRENCGGNDDNANLEEEIYKHWRLTGVKEGRDASAYGCKEDEKMIDLEELEEGFRPNIFSENTNFNVEKTPPLVAPKLPLSHLNRQRPMNKLNSKFKFTTKRRPEKKGVLYQEAIQTASKSIKNEYPDMSHANVQAILDYIQGEKHIINTLTKEQIEIAKVTANYMQSLGFNVYD